MENEKIEKLNEKLEKEFKEFCEMMKTKTPEEIIERAYEITVKEELKDEIVNMDLHDKEIEIMLGHNDLLTEFYHDWLDCDTPLGESLRENLQESVAIITRYYENKPKDKER